MTIPVCRCENVFAGASVSHQCTDCLSAATLGAMRNRSTAKSANHTQGGNGSFSICKKNKNKEAKRNKVSRLAASQKSSQRCFSTYLTRLMTSTIEREREGSARENCRAGACPVRPGHMIAWSRLMPERNQTAAQ